MSCWKKAKETEILNINAVENQSFSILFQIKFKKKPLFQQSLFIFNLFQLDYWSF